MASAVRSDTSKRLGALLLQGWAMLAENCPDCKVPLMKERTSDERLCVNCDTTFVSDGQGLRPTNRPELGHAEEEPPQHEHQQDGSENESANADDDVSCDYDPRADPRLGPFASSTPERGVYKSNASAGASQQVPQGKAVPTGAAECTSSQGGGTLASAPGATVGAATAAAGCDTGRAGKTDYAPTANGAATSTVSVGRGGEPSSSAADPVEDVADLLAAKMLQGWALLDKNCPRCNTVLVRSKANKRMFCVACDAWVVTEADTQPQLQPAASPPSPSPPPPPPRMGEEPATAEATQALAPASKSLPASGPTLDVTQPLLPIAALGPQLQELQNQTQQPPQQQLLPSLQVAGPLPTTLGASPPGVAVEPTQTRLGPRPISMAAGVPTMQCDEQLQPPHQQQQQQLLLQLPLMYQQFFTPVVAAVAAGGGTASYSRDSSPLQQWAPGQGQGQAHCSGANGIGTDGTGGGRGGSSKQASSTALLLTIGRTVALKMAEAQGLLEQTPALDTERARSYVALISECLDLLAKLHSLQQ